MMPAAPAYAVSCGTGSFQAWLDDFKNEAAAKGISQIAIASGLNGVTLDQAVLARDRSQRVFSQSFEEFSGRMVPPRLARGANMMKQYGSVLGRIEQSYGVPGEVLVAIWGLETDFGVNIGKFSTIRSLATLAYDCRRAETFRGELMDALRDGYEVYPVVDAIGGTSVEAHRAGIERVVQAGAVPIGWVSLACELKRDWNRLDTVPQIVEIVLTDRLLKE